jgi:hypothetical protein
MHVLQSFTDLLNDGSGLLLWKLSLLLDLLQTAIREGLNNQIEIFFIVEVSKEGS